jgi:hypothetical protein
MWTNPWISTPRGLENRRARRADAKAGGEHESERTCACVNERAHPTNARIAVPRAAG